MTTSLAVDGSGRLHVSYADLTNDDLKYATCAADCDAAANWQAIAVYGPENVGQAVSLAVDGSGHLHLSYADLTNEDLKYTTCAADCSTAANWAAVTVDETLSPSYISLAVDGNGRVHVSYRDHINGDLKYATCATDCTAASSWAAIAVDEVGDVGSFPSLAVDTSGRLHVSYYDATNGDLKYIE